MKKLFLENKQFVLNAASKFENFFNKKELELLRITRTVLLLIFLGLLLAFFHGKLEVLFLKVIPSPGWSNRVTDGLFLLLFLIIYLHGLRLLRKNYVFSSFQISLLLSALVVLLFFHFTEKAWRFSPVLNSDWGLTYFHLLFGIVIHFIGIVLYTSLIPPKQKKNIASFCEDISIQGNNSEPDLLNYTKLAINLKEKISYQSFINSFTVGVVGPWGNGKSSFINLLENEIKKTDSITLHFRPYLNHTEDEISMEFFHAFQEALRPYSGKVSDLILEYSNKLLNLYQTKNIRNFFKKESVNVDSSANSTFRKINSSLEEINKKIIVFVDDLDRLNEIEILQVLKLIRNTANFTNTTFIVGMDKGYVLKRLNSGDSVLDNRFIDKFFQLEIYLPEIDSSILKVQFKKILKKLIPDSQPKLEQIYSKIDSDKVLFDDHIRNLRDVKRFCNQILFEFDFVNQELDLKDFLNFILLKLKFPNFITQLRRYPERFLHLEGKEYTLRLEGEGEVEANDRENFILDLTREYFNPKKYQLYSRLNLEEDCKLESELGIQCEDSELLIKTLARLFDSEDDTPPNSIKITTNFRRFIQLDYNNSDFLFKDFENFIQQDDQSKFKEEIIKLSVDHREELIALLDYFVPQNSQEFQNSILIYLFQLETNNLDHGELMRKLSSFILIHLEENKSLERSEKNLKEWIWRLVDQDDYLQLETQLKILIYFGEIKKNNLINKNKEEIIPVVIKKYREYLERRRKEKWKVNDYSFYKIYHGIRAFGEETHDITNKVFIESLINNTENLRIFCAQITELETLGANNYKISESAKLFFGSHEAFVSFVQKGLNEKDDGDKEYLNFLKLNTIVDFKIEVIFKFKKFIPMVQKINLLRNNHEAMFNQKIEVEQVFYKIHDEAIFNLFLQHPWDMEEHFKINHLLSFTSKDGHFLVGTDYYNTKISSRYLQTMRVILEMKNLPIAVNNVVLKSSEGQIKIDGKVVIEVYSIQPN
ncbi:KAP family P-loop NTPase fold protein [Salegentibacter holothuriorum]|uniref:KAP family P-loop NTPase fold protein n=1 Tax=Salegentibacter holothuriorum TaxID=241145 RepID=UPI001592391B|nr:P-loop NTPase fold protein [Salegentibacter holothuriorum]